MKDLDLAAKHLTTSKHSLVVVRNEQIIATSKSRGVRGILSIYEKNPELLDQAAVADKIIGRAVAMICELGEVKSCYAPLISKGAIKVLEQTQINHRSEKQVEAIKNKKGTGLCPIEQLTLEFEDSKKAVKKIKEFFSE